MKPAEKQKVYRSEWPRVRKEVSKGEMYFVVDARRVGTSGKKEVFSILKEALGRAKEIAAAYNAEGAEGVEMDSKLRVEAKSASRILEPFGVSLVEAAIHYKNWKESQLVVENSKFIKDLAQEWFASKKAGSSRVLREDSIKGIKRGADFLTKHFGEKRVMAVTVNDIQKLLDSLPVTNRTKHNVKSLMSQFFNWCKRPQRSYCTVNPCDGYECDPRDPDKEGVRVAPPELVERMMRLCEEKYRSLIVYHAVCFFAGVRPHAAQKLTGENIRLNEGVLRIRKATVKTKETFDVPIEETLRVWLESYWDSNERGLIIPKKNFSNLIKKFRRDVGFRMTTYKQVKGKTVKVVSGEVEYPPDLTRHCYGSYWLAMYPAIGRNQLAENMNTSLDMIKRHYRANVDSEMARRFWAIAPAGKTVPMPFKLPTFRIMHGDLREVDAPPSMPNLMNVAPETYPR